MTAVRPWTRAPRWSARAVARALMRWVVTAALAMAVLGGALLVYGARSAAALDAQHRVEPTKTALEQQAEQERMARVEAALLAYRLREGGWPETLDALVTGSLLRERDLDTPGRHRSWHYRPAGDTYVLLPPAY